VSGETFRRPMQTWADLRMETRPGRAEAADRLARMQELRRDEVALLVALAAGRESDPDIGAELAADVLAAHHRAEQVFGDWASRAGYSHPRLVAPHRRRGFLLDLARRDRRAARGRS